MLLGRGNYQACLADGSKARDSPHPSPKQGLASIPSAEARGLTLGMIIILVHMAARNNDVRRQKEETMETRDQDNRAHLTIDISPELREQMMRRRAHRTYSESTALTALAGLKLSQ